MSRRESLTVTSTANDLIFFSVAFLILDKKFDTLTPLLSSAETSFSDSVTPDAWWAILTTSRRTVEI